MAGRPSNNGWLSLASITSTNRIHNMGYYSHRSMPVWVTRKPPATTAIALCTAKT